MLRRIRRRQRGAAIAEFVILAPVMILMWAGIDYFRSGYARRLDAIAQSHAQAWALAYSNDGRCFQNQEPWAGFTGNDNAGDPSVTGEEGSQASEEFKGGTSSSMFQYAHVNTEGSWKTKGAWWNGNAVGEVKGGTYVICDEVVPATNAESSEGSSGYSKYADQDVLKPLWGFVRSLF